MTSLFLFIGTTELLLIGAIALLLFGGKKLPEMMKGLGQGVREFKKGVNDINTSIEEDTKKESAENAPVEDHNNTEKGNKVNNEK
ncbi:MULTISPECIES: Sec-independent protein translocase subunit TatA/TatB [Prevotellaceae]|jgi:sec-independent protein translocase protein TatA|uniref:Sec-independent protein translocase subunit TatA/TatB n=1 Tax=Prevotellaceae TaxID=171552 RepID=UPI0003394878|nr:twin-arginine translocase TatA/TatE family subunit [Prevotella sp. CAG:255]CCX70181.1 sec-independent protein translocase protein TatA [Prevotella sp. CAG:255]